jgi:hypothetical protein
MERVPVVSDAREKTVLYSGPEKRLAPRFQLDAPVEFAFARGPSGSGIAANLSRSGALIEPATFASAAAKPKEGDRVSLYFRFVRGATQVPLVGTVVRFTASGFAMRFTHVDARAFHLLVTLLPQLGERLEEWTPASSDAEADDSPEPNPGQKY